jgi:hypothetical protein
MNLATSSSPPLFASILLLLAATSAPVDAAPARGGRAPVAKTQGTGLAYEIVNDGPLLVQCLVGEELQVRNATLSAADSAAGKFTGGADIIGFGGGIVLSTGTITGALGPNDEFGSEGKDHGRAGDAALDQFVDPEVTYDACILEFEFYTDQPRTITFDYVFASEEYSEFVGAGFDDVLAFFLNGTGAAQNIARVTAACATVTGVPTSVDNVNCGNQFEPTVPAVNCNCYRDNEWNFASYPPTPPALDSEMDGFTKVFTASGTSVTGWNTLRIAIADAGDGILDSNVYIRCQSFLVPVQPSSWGRVKAGYR